MFLLARWARCHFALALGMGVLVVTFSGCSTVAGQSGTPAATAPASSSSSTAGANCQTIQLTLHKAGDENGAGNFSILFALQNSSRQTCTLEGYPGVELLDASQQPMAFAIEHETSAYLFSNQHSGLVTLVPGSSSYFMLEWSAGSTSCRGAAFVLVTPPADQAGLQIASTMEICVGPLIVSPIESASFA